VGKVNCSWLTSAWLALPHVHIYEEGKGEVTERWQEPQESMEFTLMKVKENKSNLERDHC
jgi:hypothetical protein